jgi:DNA-directed RNA polymerase specialized sigma24 family protein
VNTAISNRPVTRNVLDCVAESFHSLCVSSNPPAIDGTVFGAPLPQRQIVLDELKRVLLDVATPVAVRDAVWAELIRRARTRGHEWTIGSTGVAMPALLGTLKQFRRDFPNTDTEDLAAEVLAGFLGALKTVDIDRPGIMTRVGWAVYRSARRCAYTEANSVRAAKAAASAPPKPDFGHVDLVVAKAVAEGVVSQFEADLIVTTRLEGRSLVEVGEALGMTANALRMRRRKAEARLAAWLTGVFLGDEDGGQGRMGEVGGPEDRFTARGRTSAVEAAVRGLAA